jgi:membrane protease YdiL (CAAX protease family)
VRAVIISTMEAFIKRHPVLTYFALVFVISWGSVLLMIGPHEFPLRWEEFERVGGLLYLGSFAGPFLAGILMTGLIDGRQGFRDLLARVGRWRVGARWYGLVLLLPVLAIGASRLLLSLVSSDNLPSPVSTSESSSVAAVIGLSLMVGFFEEIGWTGFAVPRLLSRHAVLATGIAVGVVWGAWHFPLFWESNTFSGSLPVGILLARLFSWLPPFRVLMVWVYDRTGSLLMVILMHAALVATQFILFPATQTGRALLMGILALAAMVWLMVTVVAVAARGQLSRNLARY